MYCVDSDQCLQTVEQIKSMVAGLDDEATSGIHSLHVLTSVQGSCSAGDLHSSRRSEEHHRVQERGAAESVGR